MTLTALGQPFWNGGETVTVSASGGVVPAFSVTVVAPPSIQITAPVVPDPWSINRASDLSFSWSPASAQPVHLQVAEGTGPTADLVLKCTVSPGAGGGAIPAALLQKFPAGASVVVSARNVQSTKKTAGEFGIEIRLETYARYSGPAYLNFSATLP